MSHRIPSPIRFPWRAVSGASNNVTVADGIVAVQGSGARTVTLPDAAICAGLVLIIKDEAGNALLNNITVDTTGNQLIDGASTQVLTINNDSLAVYSDGSGWRIWGALV